MLTLSTTLDILLVEGRLPTSLNGFVEPKSRLTDEWDGPIRFRRLDNTYQLRSAGPDRTFETDDDIVIPGWNTEQNAAPIFLKPPVSENGER